MSAVRRQICAASPGLSASTNKRGVGAVDRALAREHRDGEQRADIGEQRPEGGVRHRIEAAEAEQRIGPQQVDAERADGDEIGEQPASA